MTTICSDLKKAWFRRTWLVNIVPQVQQKMFISDHLTYFMRLVSMRHCFMCFSAAEVSISTTWWIANVMRSRTNVPGNDHFYVLTQYCGNAVLYYTSPMIHISHMLRVSYLYCHRPVAPPVPLPLSAAPPLSTNRQPRQQSRNHVVRTAWNNILYKKAPPRVRCMLYYPVPCCKGLP